MRLWGDEGADEALPKGEPGYFTTWLMWVVCLLIFILLGELFGWDTAALERDLPGLLFGAAAALSLHAARKEDA